MSDPPLLDLRFESCVRSLSVWTTCTACVEACPEEAISDDGAYQSIVVDLDRCTSCGACAAACPTDAFTAPFDVDGVVAAAGSRIQCGRDGLPCIGALATEDLISIALPLGDITVVDGACAFHGKAHGPVAQRVAEANTFLRAMGLPGTVTLEVEPASPAAGPTGEPQNTSRRGLFVGQAAPARSGKITAPKRLDKDNLQYTQDRRWRLLAHLPEGVPPSQDEVPGEQLSFLSSKRFVSENCTLCTICVRICPTGAITSGRNFKDLRFDTSQCVRCGLCHEVCQTDAVQLAEQTSLVDFVTRQPKVLDRIKARKCVECGMSYNAATNQRGLCPRCEGLEQEAIELSTVRRGLT